MEPKAVSRLKDSIQTEDLFFKDYVHILVKLILRQENILEKNDLLKQTFLAIVDDTDKDKKSVDLADDLLNLLECYAQIIEKEVEFLDSQIIVKLWSGALTIPLHPKFVNKFYCFRCKIQDFLKDIELPIPPSWNEHLSNY